MLLVHYNYKADRVLKRLRNTHRTELLRSLVSFVASCHHATGCHATQVVTLS